MIFDTNLLIRYIRSNQVLPARSVLSVVTVGEVESFALKADWGVQKVTFMENLLKRYPIIEITAGLTGVYAQVDTYSQGKLKSQPLPLGMSARNMGKNDLWLATTALYLDMEFHTSDNDFDHLEAFGLKLFKY
jgi:tRNA(fMet)-specific endonuclease VapC